MLSYLKNKNIQQKPNICDGMIQPSRIRIFIEKHQNYELVYLPGYMGIAFNGLHGTKHFFMKVEEKKEKQ